MTDEYQRGDVFRHDLSGVIGVYMGNNVMHIRGADGEWWIATFRRPVDWAFFNRIRCADGTVPPSASGSLHPDWSVAGYD